MSKSLFIILLIIVSFAFMGSAAFSETNQWESVKAVVFKDGSVVHGKITQMNADTITIQQDDGNIVVRKFDDVTNFIGAQNESIAPTTKEAGNAPIAPTVKANEGGINQASNRNIFYLVAKAGAYFPESNDLSGFSTDFNGELALGVYVNKYFAVEGGAGYRQTSKSESAYLYGYNINANANIYIVPITVSVKAILPIQFVELYALGGLGLYIAHGDINASGGGYYGSRSDTSYDPGVHLGGGININLPQNFFIGVEGKYFWDSTHWSANGIDFHENLDGLIITGNVGVKF